ncbi:hypothetical protein V6N12_057180 [Hibiscus sabdariffa]|uniref:Uncharacterized protein n=1 Tax=Hibiscus sabdariffa TaxID=183260 RepID=A0ABR1Z7Y0_9ROSI
MDRNEELEMGCASFGSTHTPGPENLAMASQGQGSGGSWYLGLVKVSNYRNNSPPPASMLLADPEPAHEN